MEKKKYIKATNQDMPLTIFKKYIIAGKKMPKAKYEMFLNTAVENILMSGFSSREELKKLVKINGYYDMNFMGTILLKLSETYEDIKQKEGEKVMCMNSPVNAAKFINASYKHDIVHIVMRELLMPVASKCIDKVLDTDMSGKKKDSKAATIIHEVKKAIEEKYEDDEVIEDDAPSKDVVESDHLEEALKKAPGDRSITIKKVPLFPHTKSPAAPVVSDITGVNVD